MSSLLSIFLILLSAILTVVALSQGVAESLSEVFSSVFVFLFRIPENSGGWIYEYQTLVGGAIAALSIWLTWQHYSHRLVRKRYTARAKMNEVLSSICSYAKESFNVVRYEKKQLPRKRSEEMAILKESLEHLDNDTSETVFELITFYQVHNARLEQYYEESDSDEVIVYRNAKTDRLYDAVRLYCLSERLFEYARNSNQYSQPVKSVKNDKLTSDQMHSSLISIHGFTKKVMAHHSPDLEELFNAISRIHD